MITHTYFLVLQVPDLQLAIFAYFDQYFLQEIRFINNIDYYEVIHLPQES